MAHLYPPGQALSSGSLTSGPHVELKATAYRTDVSIDIFSVSLTGTTGVFFQNVRRTRREGVERYETFGTFAPNGRAAGNPIERFLTPAAPINVLAGLRYEY